jgi:hypothetical protein
VSTSPLFALLLTVVGVPRRFCELFLFAVKFSRCGLRGGLWEVQGEFKKKLALANFFIVLTSNFSLLTSHMGGGTRWIRTIDLTLIRRAL